MKISTKGRYALRMLLDLAERKDDRFVSLKEIAERQNISKQYLEQIVSLLHTSNFLRANRGKQGGYMLSKAPAEITVAQVLRITEGSLVPVACLEDEENRCDRAGICKTLSVWEGLYELINEYLEGITLQDILDRHDMQGADSYSI
ncbi:MAG: Rrf2 family transcriptional regulator [Oscillospiraceae bacterium]|nr:Rrf2 family transcriptional regulator [Oscillospiraceae bacterium]